jgi:hypothetical protein
MTTITISENTGATYTGVEETWLKQNDPTNSQDGSGFYVTYWDNTDRKHALLKFTGLSNVGVGAVTNAKVRLYCSANNGGGPVPQMFALSRAWIEAQATWNNATSIVAWGTAGANNTSTDYVNTLLASVVVTSTGVYYEFTGALVDAYVSAIVNGGTDYGLLFKDAQDAQVTALNIEAVFVDSEGTNGQRPELTFDHDPNPVFTVQPGNQLTASGGTVTFTSTVSNVVSYQWQVLAPSGSGGWTNVSSGSGGTTNNYTTPTLTRADTGTQYRLQATNANGTTTSNVVEATVTSIPTSYSGIGLIVGASDSFIGEAMVGGPVSVGSASYEINAEPGTYTITGVAATFDIGIEAALGTYTLTGLPITFDFAFNAALGTYVLTGFDAGLLPDYMINAETGVYVITGFDVTFLNGYELNAESGSYVITGFDAALLGDFMTNTEPGSYIVTGVAIGSDITMNNEPGSYLITGVAASLIADYVMNAEPGVYSYTGFSINSDISMNAAPSSYLITGFDMALLADYTLDAQPGSYSITGRDTSLEDDSGGGGVAAGGDYFIYSRRRIRR